jgi:hypothetical protein
MKNAISDEAIPCYPVTADLRQHTKSAEFVMSSTQPEDAGASRTTFTSSTELAAALRRAEAAHAKHEKRTGQRDAAWADWYAAYMVAEQAGTPLPT